MQPMVAPLSPPPTGLAIATQSSQWRTIWKMLGIVFLLYIIAQIIVTALYGIVVDDAYTTLFSLICLVPFASLFFFVRRPKLTHVILATPDQNGSQLHYLPNSRVLKTPVTTKFSHHLIIDSPPLEMPPSSSIWLIFTTTIIVAFCGLLPMMLFEDEMWILLAVCVGIPAWLLGFSLPVHAWWSFQIGTSN